VPPSPQLGDESAAAAVSGGGGAAGGGGAGGGGAGGGGAGPLGLQLPSLPSLPWLPSLPSLALPPPLQSGLQGVEGSAVLEELGNPDSALRQRLPMLATLSRRFGATLLRRVAARLEADAAAPGAPRAPNPEPTPSPIFTHPNKL